MHVMHVMHVMQAEAVRKSEAARTPPFSIDIVGRGGSHVYTIAPVHRCGSNP